MAIWSNKYREQAIPGPNPAGTITEHRPGQKLAKVVTEIQEKVPNAVRSDLGEGLIDEGTAIEGGDLVLRLALEQDSENLEELLTGANESIQVVTGGTWPNLKTKTLTVENGLIKEAPDGADVDYPELPLYDGNLVAISEVNVNSTGSSDTLEVKRVVWEVENGVLKKAISSSTEVDSLPFIRKPAADPLEFAFIDYVEDIYFDDEAKAIKKKKRRLTIQNGIAVGDRELADEVVISFTPFSC